jgi:hypothetical protein
LFELSADAEVTVRLCDIMGVQVMPVATNENLPAGTHARTMDLGGLRRGNYVLHVQTNGHVTSKVVYKK